LAAGRPVVFGSYTDNDPVLESGAGISVEADNRLRWPRAIESFAAQPREKLLEYGKLGRKFVEDHYSIPVVVDRFEAMAREITGTQA